MEKMIEREKKIQRVIGCTMRLYGQVFSGPL